MDYGAIATGAGSVVGDVLNLAQSYNARQFVREQRGNAHQIEVQDLMRAGLNPILSATGGRGAGMGDSPVIPMRNPAEGLGRYLLEKQMTSAAVARETSQKNLNDANVKVAKRIEEKEEQLRSYYSAETTKTNLENMERKANAEFYKGWPGLLIKGIEKLMPILGYAIPGLGAVRAMKSLKGIERNILNIRR